MVKTIVIGDIHGHVDSVEEALAFDGNVVFVGDYLDSFGQTIENQVKCLKLVLNAIKREPGRVVGLMGNHERSYLDPAMRCSGWNHKTQQYVTHMRDQMLELLKPFHWVGEYLITHAGVDQELLDELEMDLPDYLEHRNYNQIGRYRGGNDKVGGLYWNDFNAEMTPVKGVKQVVGHSFGKGLFHEDGVRVKHGNDGVTWCVDNLGRKKEVLLIDEHGMAYPVPLTGERVGDCERDGCTNERQEPHTCPYAEEIGGDNETLCTCCIEHEGECAYDI